MENIIFITHHLGGVGGVQKFIELLATQFLKDGHHVSVIGLAVPKGNTYAGPMIQDANYQEICLYKEDIFTTKTQKLLADAYVTHKSAHFIQEFIDAQEAPIIIVANPLSYFFLKNVDLRNAKKTIGQMHNSADFLFHSKGIYRLYLYFIKTYYKYLNKVLFLTKEDALAAEQVLGWKNIDYVANPLPFQVAQADRSELTEHKIVLPGRLTAVKQIDQAIAIFAEVAAEHKDWTFDIYGDGPLEQQLQTQINDLGLPGQVTLKGFSTNISAVLQKSSIMVMTSSKEGLPMSIMEAMAYGVPVIAYDCAPGVAHLVQDNGILVPLNDQSAFTKALNKVMDDAALRKKIGDKSYDYIQQYNAEAIAQKWYDFFMEGN